MKCLQRKNWSIVTIFDKWSAGKGKNRSRYDTSRTRGKLDRSQPKKTIPSKSPLSPTRGPDFPSSLFFFFFLSFSSKRTKELFSRLSLCTHFGRSIYVLFFFSPLCSGHPLVAPFRWSYSSSYSKIYMHIDQVRDRGCLFLKRNETKYLQDASKLRLPEPVDRTRVVSLTRLLSACRAIRVTSNNTDRRKMDAFRRDTVPYFTLIAYYYYYAFYVILLKRINSVRRDRR